MSAHGLALSLLDPARALPRFTRHEGGGSDSGEVVYPLNRRVVITRGCDDWYYVRIYDGDNFAVSGHPTADAARTHIARALRLS